MNPFVYPKALHQRRFTPKQYKRYQTYKRILRLEFSGKCVYCQMPSSLKGYEGFGVDHYRPQKVFPRLSCAYSNLFYCCNSCNSRKGAYWPTTAAKELTEFIPNPCDHRMFESLRYSGAVVTGRTTAGKVAIDLLDLNDPEAVSYREFVINTVAIAEEKKIRLLTQQRSVEQRLKKGAMTQAVATAAIGEITSELAKVGKVLKVLSGAP